MRKLIQSNKLAIFSIYCILASLFITKVGFEMIEHKGIQNQSYSGERLK